MVRFQNNKKDEYMNKINIKEAKEKILNKKMNLELDGKLYRDITAVRICRFIYVKIDEFTSLQLNAKELSIVSSGFLGSSAKNVNVSSIIEDGENIIFKLVGGKTLKFIS